LMKQKPAKWSQWMALLKNRLIRLREMIQIKQKKQLKMMQLSKLSFRTHTSSWLESSTVICRSKAIVKA